MIQIKAFLLAGICLWVAGCYIQSLNPIYDEETLTFDLGLVGKWSSSGNDGEFWIFEKAGEQEYKLIGEFNENGETKRAYFEAFLSRLGDFLFLDIFPKRLQEMPDIYQAHLIPVHSFFKIHRDGNTLITQSIDFNLFKDAAERQKPDLKYMDLEDKVLLIASTDELQEFFVKYVKPDSIFQSPDTLFRKNDD